MQALLDRPFRKPVGFFENFKCNWGCCVCAVMNNDGTLCVEHNNKIDL